VRFIRTRCFCLAQPLGVVKIFATGNKDFRRSRDPNPLRALHLFYPLGQTRNPNKGRIKRLSRIIVQLTFMLISTKILCFWSDLLETNDLLRCALQVVGRIAMPSAKIREVIGNRPKQLRAYNLCNGEHTLTEISRKARINMGNLSRTTRRWVEHGIIFVVGEGAERRPLHIYPLPKREV
jgi:hypothetical protein